MNAADALNLWLHAEVSPFVATLLVVLSGVASFMSSAIGLGGGIAMLAVLASVLTPAIALPVHGVVQIGSNMGRAGMLLERVRWPFARSFAVGSVLGVAAGSMIFFALPTNVLRIVLGAFILLTVWVPRFRSSSVGPRGFAIVGVVSAFCTMFIGATGPFLASFLSPGRLTRHGVVATHAACMSAQHGLKIIAFGLLGFAFVEWLPLLAAMVACGLVGTWLGHKVLSRLPERTFAWAFRLILSALALRLLWT
jgi:uncharacterized membrane protein YfcA